MVSELDELGKRPDSVLGRRHRRTIKDVVAMRRYLRIAMEIDDLLVRAVRVQRAKP
jgi:hypothetical protein